MDWERKVYYGKDDIQSVGGESIYPEDNNFKNTNDDLLNLDSKVVDLTTHKSNPRPVSPRTTSQSRLQQSSSGNVIGTIIKIAIIFALIVIGSSIYGSVKESMVRIDITHALTMTENDIADELGIKFVEASQEESDFNQYSNDVPVCKKSDDLGLLYLDGKLTGMKIYNKKYTIYNAEIGKTHAEIETNMTYQYEDSFFILDDKPKGYTIYFYYNTTKNDCIVLAVDKAYQRVISIEYYSDYKKVSHNLSSL